MSNNAVYVSVVWTWSIVQGNKWKMPFTVCYLACFPCHYHLLVSRGGRTRAEYYNLGRILLKNCGFKWDSDFDCRLERVSSELMLIQRTRLDLKVIQA